MASYGGSEGYCIFGASLAPPPRRRLGTELDWVSHAFAVLLATWTIWVGSEPGPAGLVRTLLLGGAWILFGLGWIAFLLYSLGVERSRAELRHLVVAPAIVVLLLAVVLTAAPLHVRVALSRGSMDTLAAQVLAAPEGTTFAPRRVGLYHAEHIARIPGGMRFITREGDFFSASGFAYSPSGPPRSADDPSSAVYRHLTGPWYTWWSWEYRGD